MSQTWSQMHAVVTELSPRLVGSRLQKVRQPDDETLSLSFHGRGQNCIVILSCSSRFARFTESPGQTPTRPVPSGLLMWLRKHAKNRSLINLSLEADDRIVRLEFPDCELVAELGGRHPNLLALDQNRILKAALTTLRSELELGGHYGAPVAAMPVAQRGADNALQASAVDQEKNFVVRIADDAHARESRAIVQLMQTASKRLERRRSKIEADLARSEHMDEWKRAGELLKGQLHLLRPGLTEVVVDDWFAEGVPKKSIKLDPRLDGPKNVAAYFKRYRKARDGRQQTAERLAKTLDLISFLKGLSTENMTLDELEDTLKARGLVSKQATRASMPKSMRHPFHRFVSRANEQILVGRGGKDNHQLTFHYARGNDHWLHVRDAPGAHVIVPSRGQQRSPHQETLKDAAALAVHYSRLRGETGVHVMHALRKHVRPLKGAAPGRVTVSASTTIIDVADIERIERLFSQRLEA